MKKIVLFYSRDGNTRKVAQSISRYYSCDMEEIIDKKNRRGFFGYLSAGRDALRKRTTDIEETKRDLSQYQVFFIGTPVWGWSLTPAVRAFLKKYNLSKKKAVFFCTMGGSGDKRTFKMLEGLLPHTEVVSSFSFKQSQVTNNDYQSALEDILNRLNIKES